jgi:hypothetical protein
MNTLYLLALWLVAFTGGLCAGLLLARLLPYEQPRWVLADSYAAFWLTRAARLLLARRNPRQTFFLLKLWLLCAPWEPNADAIRLVLITFAEGQIAAHAARREGGSDAK